MFQRVFFAAGVFAGVLTVGLPCSADRPNLLMIMVDDMGFSDLGCYGSEIDTPHLDALAENGLRFNQFYNTAKCHSSRVSLLTGQYCIAAGDTSLHHAVTTAEVLGGAGYFTAMTGKWHLKQQPTDFGYQRYFGHLSGACNYFRGDNTFRLNGQPWKVPESGFYTTTANVDFAIDFLDQARQAKQPWYLYVAFNAPHAPLQALPEDYAKYEGRYDVGWDQVRQRRVEKQKQLGLLPTSTQESPRPEHVPAWEQLDAPRRQFESKRMATLAAMIDRVDQEVGRLIDDLKSAGELDNTLICFVSDNGACPYDRRSNAVDQRPTDGAVSWSDSTGWAWARNTPFRYYKQNQFEGGICTPAIVHWPKGIRAQPGSVVTQPAHLIDLMPTFADVADASVPTEFPGRDLRPVSGQSLAPIFRGEQIERSQPLHFLFSRDRALREGDWKVVSFRSEAWELYNLQRDRTELQDLAPLHPDRVERMVRTWTEMTRELLHASPQVYQPVGPAKLPHTHPEWTDFSRQPGVPAGGGNRQRARGGNRPPAKLIRARKNTQLRTDGDRLELTFTGEDPGLAFDRLPETIGGGPYTLSFWLTVDAEGDGEVYYTTDDNTSLPNGHHLELPIAAVKSERHYEVPIPTSERLRKIRLDVSEGSGTAVIRQLRLTNQSGDVVAKWPE